MHQRQPAVTDANIWIDLENTGLFASALALPLDYAAPDLIIEELGKPTGRLLAQMGLRKEELSGEEVASMVRLGEKYRRPSRKDLSALVLAARLHAILLTGDAHLRRAAGTEGLEVHGTLWFLELMEVKGTASPAAALAGLEHMLNKPKPARLPKRECERLRSKWKAMDQA